MPGELNEKQIRQTVIILGLPSSRMTAKLVCDALKMAIWQRKPERGLIVHSDRGSQYASHEYRNLLKLHGCIGSMSRKGNCWDNACRGSRPKYS